MTQQELMEYGMRVMNPSEKHKLLERFTGNWEVETDFVMEPGSPAMKLKSSSNAELVMGKRFVEIYTSGMVMGMPFESKQTIGHDNRKEIYTLYGIDAMGTYAVYAEGTFDEDSQTLTLYGEEDDPIFLAPRKFKFVHHFIDEDNREYELWFLTDEKGKDAPYKAVSAKVTRKKD